MEVGSNQEIPAQAKLRLSRSPGDQMTDRSNYQSPGRNSCKQKHTTPTYMSISTGNTRPHAEQVWLYLQVLLSPSPD